MDTRLFNDELENLINQIIEKWVELLEIKEGVTQKVFLRPTVTTVWRNLNLETLTMLKETVILKVLLKILSMIAEEELPWLKSVLEMLISISKTQKISSLLKACTPDNTSTAVNVPDWPLVISSR